MIFQLKKEIMLNSILCDVVVNDASAWSLLQAASILRNYNCVAISEHKEGNSCHKASERTLYLGSLTTAHLIMTIGWHGWKSFLGFCVWSLARRRY